MGVVQRVRNVLSGERNRERSGATDRDQSGDPDLRGPESDDGTDTRTTNLYHCEPCGTTYVSDDLDACSQCGNSLERVPTEQDLGLV
ncbi:hypothetical protein L593_07040 [Salinarchaeum sp. Harcht-Bsk1]|uniref:hypothetical protein n=1 Tax=Salinarchaeum sp. Harcht-Bsk1 TaxID=1333523 RepID=UPI000342401F|nr:hypothetical protein [Salinarchaeum sp. Harcht-Bsk1]AGN01355.1 hypothetical protein L593_07040 [Salinarchaeum sp. Harcht-Bsk1]